MTTCMACPAQTTAPDGAGWLHLSHLDVWTCSPPCAAVTCQEFPPPALAPVPAARRPAQAKSPAKPAPKSRRSTKSPAKVASPAAKTSPRPADGCVRCGRTTEQRCMACLRPVCTHCAIATTIADVCSPACSTLRPDELVPMPTTRPAQSQEEA